MTISTPLREPRPGASYVEVPAQAPRAWPQEARVLDVRVAGDGREVGLEEFLTLTATTAFLVVVDGVLVEERYFGGATAGDRLLGYSATKAALALLTGLAVDRGLASLDSVVGDLVPELRESGYAPVTLHHLLTMTSGVGWTEDYRDPASPASLMLEAFRRGRGGMRGALASIPGEEPPGRRFAYCTADSLVLDWVRERATGLSFAEALGELWNRLGSERPAVVGLDADPAHGGVASAGAGLAATARDWARLGALQLDGSWDGDRILSPDWVEATSRPSHSFTRPGRLPSTLTTHAGFGGHWWPLDAEGSRVMADGMRGQLVLVDRVRRTVVVKLSAWPYDDPWQDRQCRDLSYLVLPAIAEAAERAS
jgi:CubicO group peptidase (beta-lactamase class C family)